MKLQKKHVVEILEQHKLMSVATYDNHPWIATVFFSFDKELNLYFLSAPRTLHCRHIEKNDKVAVAIFDSKQKPSDKKKGLQIYGVAKPISKKVIFKHALRLWKGSMNIKDPEMTYENMVKNPKGGRMYKISPKRIKFFNQELFKTKDGKEPILEL